MEYKAVQVETFATHSQRRPLTKWRSGMSYKAVNPDGRRGLASIQDSGYVAQRASQINSNMGEGVMRYAAIGRDGHIIKNATREVNGKLYNSKHGTFTTVDKGCYDYRRLRELEVEEEITKVIPYCVLTDEMTMEILDFDDEQYNRVFGNGENNDLWKRGMPGSEFSTDKSIHMPSSIANVDCRASHIRVLPEGSKEYLKAIAKLRYIISQNMPILEDNTPNTVITRENALQEAILPQEAPHLNRTYGADQPGPLQ